MQKKLPLKIAGVGRYVPERVVSNAEIEEMAGLPLGYIATTAAGVRERRWVNGETATFMGAEAAREAIEDAGMSVEDIDLILNASGSQEQAIPDGGPLIQRHLGLADSGTAAMSVHSTCLSFLVALNVAANFINSGQYRNIVIVSSEIGSAAINPQEPESFVLFGDIAAAVVVTRPQNGDTGSLNGYVFRTFGEGAYLTCVMGGGTRKHPNRPQTEPTDNLFHMDGRKVFRLARKHGKETLERLRPGLSDGLDGIRMVIPHQASGLAIRYYTRYGWPAERIAVSLDRFGNCIAASIPATLYEVVRGKRIERGDDLLLVGTGAGLSIGAAILTY